MIARVNSGSFALDEDVARGYTLFLGSLRPWIGSIFGLLIYFAVTSNFVQIFEVPDDPTEAFYFFACSRSRAGFSERWAQDTLTGGLTGRGRGKADDAAAPASAPAAAKDAAAKPPAATVADAQAELDAS